MSQEFALNLRTTTLHQVSSADVATTAPPDSGKSASLQSLKLLFLEEKQPSNTHSRTLTPLQSRQLSLPPVPMPWFIIEDRHIQHLGEDAIRRYGGELGVLPPHLIDVHNKRRHSMVASAAHKVAPDPSNMATSNTPLRRHRVRRCSLPPTHMDFVKSRERAIRTNDASVSPLAAGADKNPHHPAHRYDTPNESNVSSLPSSAPEEQVVSQEESVQTVSKSHRMPTAPTLDPPAASQLQPITQSPPTISISISEEKFEEESKQSIPQHCSTPLESTSTQASDTNPNIALNCNASTRILSLSSPHTISIAPNPPQETPPKETKHQASNTTASTPMVSQHTQSPTISQRHTSSQTDEHLLPSSPPAAPPNPESQDETTQSDAPQTIETSIQTLTSPTMTSSSQTHALLLTTTSAQTDEIASTLSDSQHPLADQQIPQYVIQYLEERDRILLEREMELTNREQLVAQREHSLALQKDSLSMREMRVQSGEKDMKEKERTLKLRFAKHQKMLREQTDDLLKQEQQLENDVAHTKQFSHNYWKLQEHSNAEAKILRMRVDGLVKSLEEKTRAYNNLWEVYNREKHASQMTGHHGSFVSPLREGSPARKRSKAVDELIHKKRAEIFEQ
mmetsp:Transcript_11071/g.41304  ORF Transcript_11071/g.41304 Transcript_11071/m.41304 type:complete len:622 (-) Transcript_11071:4393-6258(-)